MMTINNKCHQLLSCLLVILLVTPSMSSFAKSVDDLIKNNELTIKVTLVASASIVAKQPVTLVIKVATNRWFAKGTKIHDIDLSEAVILTNRVLVINGTERINGTTWAVQTREIIIYPMQVGIYELAPVLVDVSINTENDGIVSGTIKTKALEFETTTRTELKDIDHYIVTPELSVAIAGAFDTYKEYQVGEAITETITIKVIDVPSMMILPLAKSQLDGVSIYQKPVKVSDQNVRGSITGVREESTTYIFEKAGEYQIPQQILHWWNPEISQLESEIIPVRKWTVVGTSLGEKQALEKTFIGSLFQNYIINLLIILFLILILWQGIKYKEWLINFYNKATNKKVSNCKNSFLRAIHKQQWQLACQQLYLFIYINKSPWKVDHPLYKESAYICFKDYFSDDIENTLLVNKLLKAAYQKSDDQLTVAEAKNLIKKKHEINKGTTLFISKKTIKLNPMNEDV